MTEDDKFQIVYQKPKEYVSEQCVFCAIYQQECFTCGLGRKKLLDRWTIEDEEDERDIMQICQDIEYLKWLIERTTGKIIKGRCKRRLERKLYVREGLFRAHVYRTQNRSLLHSLGYHNMKRLIKSKYQRPSNTK